MIKKDRALLARLASFNRGLAPAVVELMAHQDNEGLPAAGLRAISDEMAKLVDDLRARAEELERLVVDADGQP